MLLPYAVGMRAARAGGLFPLQAMPDPLHRLPKRPPDEPLIIKIPYRRPPEDPEIDTPPDDEDVPEIRRPPAIIPEREPPPAPWERSARPSASTIRDRPGTAECRRAREEPGIGIPNGRGMAKPLND